MVQEYLDEEKRNTFPRLPLEGHIDLTYRCNNNCRHCWVRIPEDSPKQNNELTCDEIKKIVTDARKMGCRAWAISGGEPMLRPDFGQVLEFITCHSNSYSLNTNGTLITHKIAGLMKRKGAKMAALYGATAAVHDHITRNPGSFELTMRGLRYLKEASAGFMVQLIPMKDNYHQFQDMIALAKSLSRHYRVGAAWLYLSSCGDMKKNKEIMRQRLEAKEAIELDKPDSSCEKLMEGHYNQCDKQVDSKYLFSSCIHNRRDFHVDPYAGMTFCTFIKNDTMRYDLRRGNFQEAWENFIPSLASKFKFTEEYQKNCGSCNLRKDCRICPVYAFLEHRDFNKKVEYLCLLAKENRNYKENWQRNHRRYFKIAGITIQLESDLPIQAHTFHKKFKQFEVSAPGEDIIYISHHFLLPEFNGKDLGVQVYRRLPWAVYKNNGSWIYLGIPPVQKDKELFQVVICNSGHTHTRIYNDREEMFIKGGLHSLTMLPSDQILLARVLADRQGCYFHSCGVNLKGKGLLFLGHSEAGKSTMAWMLKGKAEILCDDRIIVRKQPHAGFRIYGTWSHGDVPEVSANSVRLHAIMFLEKAEVNVLEPLEDKKEKTRRLLACLIRPFVGGGWWEKMLSLIEMISEEIPCYVLKFDKSARVIDMLEGV